MKTVLSTRLAAIRKQQFIRFLEYFSLFAGFYLVTFSVFLIEGGVIHRSAVYALITATAKYCVYATHRYCWLKMRP